MSTSNALLASVIAAALLAATPADAVRLSDNGNGDLLIFPVVDLGSGFGVALSLYPEHDEVASLLRLNLRDGSDGSLRGALNIAVPAFATATISMSGSSATVTGDLCASSSSSPDSWSLDTTLDLGDDFGGYLEVIEMARVDRSEEAWDAFGLGTPGDEAAPMDCAAVGDYLGNAENVAALSPTSTAVVNPGGDGVSGNLHLVDVENGLSFSIAPTVMREFRDAPLYAPADSEQPSLADASPATSTVRARHGAGSAAAVTERISTWERPEDAVSAVLMSARLQTEFSVQESLGASSDLLLTFPTRRYYVGAEGDQERAPFEVRYLESPLEEVGQQFTLDTVDRSGNMRRPSLPDAGAKCTPPAPLLVPAPVLSASQMTVHIGEQPIVSAGQIFEAVQPYLEYVSTCTVYNAEPVRALYESGMVVAGFMPFSMTSLEGHVFRGLPLIATSVTQVINNQLQGDVRANYGLVNEVATQRFATVGEPD